MSSLFRNSTLETVFRPIFRSLEDVQNVAGPVVEMARLLSFLVHLASAVGDVRVFAVASAYIFMLIMAKLCCRA